MQETREANGKDFQPAVAQLPPEFAPRPARTELVQQGKALRDRCPRGAHAVWKATHDRTDPVRLVEEANAGRLPDLIPLRHGRMLQSPFTFFRGTALNMAVDLASSPATGLYVQACGDAHLGNFRCFATPERRVIFDIHDLDETLPAPWEWDVKRLASSFVLACRTNGLGASVAQDAVLRCVRSYRKCMAEFSRMRALDIWYASHEAAELFADITDAAARADARKRLAKVKGLCVFEDDFPKLADTSKGAPRIKDDPPVIYHQLRHGEDAFYETISQIMIRYRESLSDDRRVLLDRYRVKDKAVKVVGVGSVGTVCSVVLLMAGAEDPLFLQVKEARASVLEAFAGKSVYANHGQRVIQGHRLMQSASDIFLGWTQGLDGRHFYVRQLRDMKIRFRVEEFKASKMLQFADWCGATLARAHARSGEPAIICGYLGKSDRFDRAIALFASAYADQCERDHECLVDAVRDRRLETQMEDDG